jgi:hypothetical protein
LNQIETCPKLKCPTPSFFFILKHQNKDNLTN